MTETLSRRAALQVLGAIAVPSLARAASLPADWTFAAHQGATATPPALFQPDERAVVSAIADALLPRTDTLGALDAGAPAFIEFITAEWMTDAERTAFRTGIAEIDAHALATHGKSWPALDAAQRDRELAWADDPTREPTPAQRTFRRLKSYALHGYFTSERVQREVLRTNIVPGRYFGCNPIPAPRGDDE